MKWFKKIASLSLIVVVLFATVGFSVSRHYCMGMMVEESFYSPAHSCEMETFDEHHDGDTDHFKKNCCDDEQLIIPGIEVVNKGGVKSFDLTKSLALLQSDKNYSEPVFENLDYTYTQYFPPPDEDQNLLVLYQRFLI